MALGRRRRVVVSSAGHQRGQLEDAEPWSTVLRQGHGDVEGRSADGLLRRPSRPAGEPLQLSIGEACSCFMHAISEGEMASRLFYTAPQVVTSHRPRVPAWLICNMEPHDASII